MKEEAAAEQGSETTTTNKLSTSFELDAMGGANAECPTGATTEIGAGSTMIGNFRRNHHSRWGCQMDGRAL
jgi:hypothetical protein